MGSVADQRMELKSTRTGNAFEYLTIDGERDLSVLHAQKFTTPTDGVPDENQLGMLETFYQLLVKNNGSLEVKTSGTTGIPKRLTIVKDDLIASALLTGETFGLKEGDRVLHCLPTNFIAGKMMLVRAMVLGLDLHIVDPKGSVLDNLATHDRFRFAAMIPLQLHRAMQEDRDRVERQFDTILLGGGPVSMALIEDIRELNVKVYQGYGSTETVTHVAMRRLNGPTRSDRYHAIGRVSFYKDDRDCLIVRTPHLSTKQHITNDLVTVLDEHSFRWRGRIDNVILSGGKKIFPEQLEERTGGLLPYPHFFMGIPHDKLGQAVALVIETEQPDPGAVQEVVEILQNILHPHEMPRRVSATRKIMRTRTGKIVRRV
jgi:O-succinylbenzoic acid--CoA ligase